MSGCKKIIEKQKENFVLSVMTEGQWTITKFVMAGDTITSDFSEYSFQFNRDYTVDAIRENAPTIKGNWEGDPDAMNIVALFPLSSEPLSLITGTWHIEDNSLSYVVASLQNGPEERALRLEKK